MSSVFLKATKNKMLFQGSPLEKVVKEVVIVNEVLENDLVKETLQAPQRLFRKLPILGKKLFGWSLFIMKSTKWFLETI